MDRYCVEHLTRAGMSVYSEESGFTSAPIAGHWTVVLDPVDGSTNASREIPLFVLSCALLHDGELVAGYVHELTNHSLYWAIRGEGAFWGTNALAHPRGETNLRSAVVGVNGYPRSYLGWAQYRALGCAALELSMVASGQLDAYVDCSKVGLATWDYLGALAILREAGCAAKSLGTGLAPEDDVMGPRRHLVAARGNALLEELGAAWERSMAP